MKINMTILFLYSYLLSPNTISKQMAGRILLLAWQTPLLDEFNALQSPMRHMVTSILLKSKKFECDSRHLF